MIQEKIKRKRIKSMDFKQELEETILKYKEKFGKMPKGWGDGSQQSADEYLANLKKEILKINTKEELKKL